MTDVDKVDVGDTLQMIRLVGWYHYALLAA